MKHGGNHAFGAERGCHRRIIRSPYLAFDDAAEPQLTIYDVAETACSLRPGRCSPARGVRSGCSSTRRIATPARFSFRSTPAARFGAANVTVELMRAKPGPVYGWPSRFAGLGAEMSGRLSKEAAPSCLRASSMRGTERPPSPC